jgi:DNA-binding NarL/FixJ family response regulator
VGGLHRGIPPLTGRFKTVTTIFMKEVGMKVFLVDDSAIVLEKLAAMISGIDGVEIAGQALNARDAIQSIVKLKPAVVILDIRLNGGGNGMDVLKRIKKEIPPPIIIMLTNYPYPQYREKCQALGADYFFDKVTEIEKIYDTFKQLMKGNQGSGTRDQGPE